MLHNFGEVDESSRPNNNSFILRFKYTEFHNTSVTFNMDASNIEFIVNASKGRIIKANTEGFTRDTPRAGKVFIKVQNEGKLTADFNVVLSECFGQMDFLGKKVTILPGQAKVVIFQLLGGNKSNHSVQCEGKSV